MPGSTNCSPGLRTRSTVHPAAHSTGVQLLRTPLLWLAGASVLLVRCPGGLLVLPGVPSVQADALAAILTEDAV